MFEDRTVTVANGVIIDNYAGLERHVYVVDGIPNGVEPRPVPEVGGVHVTSAGAVWRSQTTIGISKFR